MSNDYPKYLYHREHGARLLETAKQEAGLGEGWADTPFPEPQPPAADELPVCESCLTLREEIANMQKQFDGSWRELKKEYSDLEKAHARLQKERDELKAENARLQEEAKGRKDAEKEPEGKTEAEPAPEAENETTPGRRRKAK